MAAIDCVGWYTISSSLSGKTMEAKYNLCGDYCTLSVQNLHLCDGWHDMFYSLPVAPIENSGVVGENSQGELTYCTTTIHEGVSVMKLHRAGVSNTGFKESTISFVLTYKYK